ncbi:MAG: hypothetical protein PF508_11245 [Spirochaeta sp.]|nr:hypothetical protein [Spirochaeta sp.]
MGTTFFRKTSYRIAKRYRVIADRVSRDEETMAQVNNHSTEQVMHGLFPKRVEDAVLDSMTDHEKLSLQILDNEKAGRDFARLILRLLTSASFGQANAGN